MDNIVWDGYKLIVNWWLSFSSIISSFTTSNCIWGIPVLLQIRDTISKIINILKTRQQQKQNTEYVYEDYNQNRTKNLKFSKKYVFFLKFSHIFSQTHFHIPLFAFELGPKIAATPASIKSHA